MQDIEIKIINILQEESNYTDKGGTFVWKLSQDTDQTWQGLFHESPGYGKEEFSYRPKPSFKANDKISIMADIDGEYGIVALTNALKIMVAKTNEKYNEQERARFKQEEEQRVKKDELDARVKQIIGSIHF